MIIDEKPSDYLEPPPAYESHMYESDDERLRHPSVRAPPRRHTLATPALEYSTYQAQGKGLLSSANITQAGRIDVEVTLNKSLPDLPVGYANPIREFAVDPSLSTATGSGEAGRVPKMSIVIMIVGSRGDVQPFVALGKELLKHGHRVRIATHETFRTFVKETGLEFYNIGGDPHDLMSYMVRNPGLMPGWASLTNGDIPRKQRMLAEILDGCWNACSQPDIDRKPFIADAIISNPPAFAHVHCAEALGIPLQLSFTMPWSPTTAFPQPLVNISQSNAEPGLTNYLTYGLADMMTWQGLGGVINEFRSTRLGLEPLTVRSGPGVVDRLKVPWTYCFSPEIVPKPEDWQNHIDVVGFYFLDLASSYQPPPDLLAFLAAGPPPVYIGFGSVVVEDPAEMTKVIFEATEKAGVRALVSAGWGGLGNTRIPPHIFMLGNIPHDWLFNHVSAVCHHGGAGTTAIGLRLGKPTIIVPFFGDQPFWGAMVHRAGAGPKPIRPEKLNVERLTRSIEYCLTEEARHAAGQLGRHIRAQNGVANGVESFHQHLPLLNMRCDLLPDELAVWWSAEHCLKLSALTAQVLSEEKLLNIHKLEIHRSKEYDTRAKSSDPLSGGVVEALRAITTFSSSLAQIFTAPKKGLINTTTAIPRSLLHILDSFTDGFSHLPATYGSAVREPGKMKDFQSGVKEGGKAFFFGMSDGITGLWTEPAEGFKTGGWKGLAEGTARSYANLAIRPTAGAFSLVTYPIRGAMMSLNRQDTAVERHLRQLRVDQGKDATNVDPETPFTGSSVSPVETPVLDDDKDFDFDLDAKKKHHHRVRRREEKFEQYLRGLHAAPPESLADAAARAKIIELFNEACKKENLKQRKKAMQKRVQWIITKGNVASVTQVSQKEEAYFAPAQLLPGRRPNKAKEDIHIMPNPTKKLQKAREDSDSLATGRRLQKRRHSSQSSRTGPISPSTPSWTSPSIHFFGPTLSPNPPPLPPRPTHSPSSSRDMATEWTEEDEEHFSKQLEEAIKLSAREPASPHSYHESSSSSPIVQTPSRNMSPDYKVQIMEAAAMWTEHSPTSSPRASLDHLSLRDTKALPDIPKE